MLKSLDSKDVKKYVVSSDCKSHIMWNNVKKVSDYLSLIHIPELKVSQTSKTTLFKAFRIIFYKKRYAKIILGLVDELEIDIIHFNNSVFSYVYSEISKSSKVKIVTHVREMVTSYDGFVARYIKRNISHYSDLIICISDNESRPFQDAGSVVVLPNPFDFNGLSSNPKLKYDYCISSDSLLVAMLGRCERTKGHLEFLKMAENFFTIRPNRVVYFVMIGVNKPKITVKSLIKRFIFLRNDFASEVLKAIELHPYKEHIKVIPYISNVEDYLLDVDVLVRPSLFGDPWGRDIIEAMANQIPVVAYGSSDFYVKSGSTGFLCGFDNNRAVSFIRKLTDDEILRKKFGQTGKAKIMADCDLSIYSERLLNLYSIIC